MKSADIFLINSLINSFIKVLITNFDVMWLLLKFGMLCSYQCYLPNVTKRHQRFCSSPDGSANVDTNEPPVSQTTQWKQVMLTAHLAWWAALILLIIKGIIK